MNEEEKKREMRFQTLALIRKCNESVGTNLDEFILSLDDDDFVMLQRMGVILIRKCVSVRANTWLMDAAKREVVL